MSTATNLGFTYLSNSQSQKEVTVNEALAVMDSFYRGAESQNTATPPTTPSDGDLYILPPAGCTGDWAGHENEIAVYRGGWTFTTPPNGFHIGIANTSTIYVWNGTVWESTAGGGGGAGAMNDLSDVTLTSPQDNHILQYSTGGFINTPSLSNLTRVGINTADAGNELSVSGGSALFAASTGDFRIYLNKANTSAVASYMFQSNWTGHAEFGLIGDNDFMFKVSPDGGTWHESFQIDRASGDVTFKQNVTFEGAGSSQNMVVFQIGDITNATYPLIPSTPFAGSIVSVTTKAAWGTCIFQVRINGTFLGGGGNSVSSSRATSTHSTSNTFNAGDDIDLIVSSNSGAAYVALVIEFG